MNQKDLHQHQASAEVRRKAEAAGIDLDSRGRENPSMYAMLNAQRLLAVAIELKEDLAQRLYALFPEHQLFDLHPCSSQNRKTRDLVDIPASRNSRA